VRRINIRGQPVARPVGSSSITEEEFTNLVNSLNFTGVDLSNDVPVGLTLGGSGSSGTSEEAARADHAHAVTHGNQAGGMLHSVVTTVTAGFMSSADKIRLDDLVVAAGLSVYVWNESPVGTRNGTNRTFTLAKSPVPTDSLALFRNGLLLKQGSPFDYWLSGRTVTVVSPIAPTTVDVLAASYTAGPTFYIHVYNESPVGLRNGINRSFSISYMPVPVNSLLLYKNGLIQKAGSPFDYTLSGSTVLFTSPNTPEATDVLVASYTRGVNYV